MEVVLDAVDEELHHVLRRRRSFRSLPLDDGQQLGDDLTLLIASEQVRDQACGSHDIFHYNNKFSS